MKEDLYMRKGKAIIAGIIILFIFFIGGVVAYFTASQTITNTFTIGNIQISLTEPNWVTTDSDNNGVPDAAQGKMPGQTVAKNPTITNIGDNAAFVFAEVQVPCTDDGSLELFTYTVNTGWYTMSNGSCASSGGQMVATKRYAYGTSSAMTSVAKQGTAVLFNEVVVNGSITGSEAGISGNKQVIVTAYAIQADGLGSATDPTSVWTKF
jgi:predicted ribosomally synthesized peptide with SipW-like signal peptide